MACLLETMMKSKDHRDIWPLWDWPTRRDGVLGNCANPLDGRVHIDGVDSSTSRVWLCILLTARAQKAMHCVAGFNMVHGRFNFASSRSPSLDGPSRQICRCGRVGDTMCLKQKNVWGALSALEFLAPVILTLLGPHQCRTWQHGLPNNICLILFVGLAEPKTGLAGHCFTQRRLQSSCRHPETYLCKDQR